ncbi:hypothetical protein DFP72DRAFT_28338 [Ephemerocybe angulata]|uniref:Uncharacterized protein n=1 Tax=Ephemerocybe angulata TaxID=980116 RepID=A0A8H6MHK5_9AGAR|nr:hypothetical protein DFP72DRAFT_28338 [Tulosesus angulatus]
MTDAALELLDAALMHDDDVDCDNDISYFRIPSSSSSFFALATLSMPSPVPSLTSVSSVDFDDLPIFLVDSVAQSSVESSPARSFEDSDAHGIANISGSDSILSSCGSFGTFGPRYHGPLLSKSEYLDQEPGPLEEGDFADHVDFKSGEVVAIPPFVESLGYLASDSRLVLQRRRARPKAIAAVSPRFDTGRRKEPPLTAPQPANCHGIRDEEPRNIHPYSCGDADRRNLREAKTSPEALKGGGRDTPGRGSEQRNLGRRPATVRSRKTAPMARTKELEPTTEFVWLHGISIALLIDQEGFRSATPSFKYSGVNRSKLDQTTCTVIFKANSKNGFNFHYNPFDRLPILRRVTIHGEESKDYISKQAQLTLKANGVYSVHGAEISSLSPMHARILSPLMAATEPEKLDWEFQYLVNDRLDVHGRVLDGEKELVPLTFTCSPWLLHPSQGKRVNLIHIFKKGVSTKLTAEKTRKAAPPPLLRTVLDPGISLCASESLHMPTSQYMLDEDLGPIKLHRRAKSQAVRKNRDNWETKELPTSGSRSSLIRGAAVDNSKGASDSKPGEKYPLRRASSAGERSWLSMSM